MTDKTPAPCQACPWLTANHGKRHPDGWYTKRNLSRLWAGLRRGEDMSCHPTDPRNPVSDRAAAAGYRAAPDHAETRECVGAWILKQREIVLFQEANGLAAYRRARPRGLTREGLAAAVGRIMFGGVPLLGGGAKVGRPDLNAPVSMDGLPWQNREATTDA